MVSKKLNVHIQWESIMYVWAIEVVSWEHFFHNLQRPLEQIALLYTVARQIPFQCYLRETLIVHNHPQQLEQQKSDC